MLKLNKNPVWVPKVIRIRHPTGSPPRTNMVSHQMQLFPKPLNPQRPPSRHLTRSISADKALSRATKCRGHHLRATALRFQAKIMSSKDSSPVEVSTRTPRWVDQADSPWANQATKHIPIKLPTRTQSRSTADSKWRTSQTTLLS